MQTSGTPALQRRLGREHAGSASVHLESQTSTVPSPRQQNVL